MTPDISLYVLVDPGRARGRPLDALAREAALGGATLVQYRDKAASTRAMIETARAIHRALAGTGAAFVVNDRVDVALAAGADGVHVGRDDMAPEDARRLLGDDAIVGLTLKSVAEAESAPVGALSYACVGGVFATLSKHNPDPPVGLEGFARIAAAFRAQAPRVPVGAIAGIDAGNALSVMATGADGVAVMSAVTMADEPRRAAAALRAVLSRPAR